MQALLQRASSGQRFDRRNLRATGLPQELAEYTGLDADTATKSLQQTLSSLGSVMGNPEAM